MSLCVIPTDGRSDTGRDPCPMPRASRPLPNQRAQPAAQTTRPPAHIPRPFPIPACARDKLNKMKVLHLAAGNRWTGAAAPAFAEVEALREAGVDAHYAYVGGYKLQAKLAHHDFAHPLIEKAQNPFSFSRTVAKLEHMVEQHGFDIIHAHLTY